METPITRTPRIDIPTERITEHGKIQAKKLKFEDLSQRQLEGAIAWKQGWIYKLWVVPYGQADIINTKEPIPGVKYYDGPGSAAKSIVVKYGEIPPHVRRDMGIVDIDVFRSKEGGKQPTIKYKPDRGQKTKYAGVVALSTSKESEL